MIYRQLFDRLARDRVVQAGLIGSGEFGTAIVTQSRVVPRLRVPVVADVDVGAARRACLLAGIAEEKIEVCDSRKAALHALEAGRTVVLGDAGLMMDLPIDVVVEATGIPEAGALHAQAAIRHHRHVVMVNKETDATVGPILKHLADKEGVVYSAADGDQHGLIMGLVAWARELGLEVLCAGKALGGDFVYDDAAGSVYREGVRSVVDRAKLVVLKPALGAGAASAAEERAGLLGSPAKAGGYDVVEMAIAANATGLGPDTDGMHSPILYAAEIPQVLCPVEEGGVLRHRGVIDVVRVLRRPDEMGLGGGVFVVVACANEYSRRVLATKGLVFNSRRSAALICRPHHLCGVEAIISILAAGALGVPTGATEYVPRFDVVAMAARDLAAGDAVGNDHSPALTALMRPARRVEPGAGLPFHMANGNRLAVNVPTGTVITMEMVVPPSDSALWSLRKMQDEFFFP